jgi:hypothetical protein
LKFCATELDDVKHANTLKIWRTVERRWEEQGKPGTIVNEGKGSNVKKTRIPRDAKRIPLRPLALGEVTGHSHSLAVEADEDVEMYERNGEIFVRVVRETPGRHEEHKPHLAPSGTEWGIRIATEVNDWGRAPVRD